MQCSRGSRAHTTPFAVSDAPVASGEPAMGFSSGLPFLNHPNRVYPAADGVFFGFFFVFRDANNFCGSIWMLLEKHLGSSESAGSQLHPHFPRPRPLRPRSRPAGGAATPAYGEQQAALWGAEHPGPCSQPRHSAALPSPSTKGPCNNPLWWQTHVRTSRGAPKGGNLLRVLPIACSPQALLPSAPPRLIRY